MEPKYKLSTIYPLVLAELQRVQPEAGWHDISLDWLTACARQDGLGIDFGSEWNKPDFLKIGGTTGGKVPFRLPYNKSYGNIYVNAGRGAEVIVKEIIRRLLPTWEPVFKEGFDLAIEDEVFANGKKKVAQQLLALGGVDWTFNGSDEPRVKFGHIILHVSSPDSVYMDGHLYLTPTVAADVIKFLQEKHPEVVRG